MTQEIEEIARVLSGTDEPIIGDTEFAEVCVSAFLKWKTGNADRELTAEDMRTVDTAELTGKLKDILDEILFGKDICSSAWWKEKSDEV